MAHPLISLFIKVTIFTLMLSLGVNQSFEHLRSLFHRPGSLLRSLLSVVVIFPILVMLLVRLFDLHSDLVIGLAVLAAAPGAPLTYKRSAMAGGNPIYSVSLQLTIALCAIVATPLILWIFYAFFQIDEKASILEVARQIAIVQVLPISIGLLLQKLPGGFAAAISKPLTILANVLFFLLIGVLLLPSLKLVDKVGIFPIAVIALLVLVSLGIGYLLGSPALFRQRSSLAVNERSVLAIATIARNLGLALMIVDISGAQKTVLPTLLAYTLVSAVIAIPFSLWSKRQSVPAA